LSENIQRLSDKLDTSRPAGNTENSVPDDRDNPPQESRVGEQHSENADNSAITENDSENETESNLINNQKRRIKEVLKEISVDNVSIAASGNLDNLLNHLVQPTPSKKSKKTK